jgi:hypothetical protein
LDDFYFLAGCEVAGGLGFRAHALNGGHDGSLLIGGGISER